MLANMHFVHLKSLESGVFLNLVDSLFHRLNFSASVLALPIDRRIQLGQRNAL